MKIFSIALIALFICSCASEPEQQEESAGPAVDISDIAVFYDEPTVEYQELDDINMTARGETAMATVEKVMARAAELGGNGIIVHSIDNKSRNAGGADRFGTGGGNRPGVYQVRATAIRYTN